MATLGDPAVADLADGCRGRSLDRRILLALLFAARSLAVTEETARAAGWFDPIIVGSSPFPGTQGGENRRKPWDLTAVSQRWLRDLLWDYLRDEALKPNGKRLATGTVNTRIAAIVLLSTMLRQIRDDNGNNPGLLGGADARAVKETWDLWFREHIPLPFWADSSRQPSVMNQHSRFVYMSSIRIVLQHSHERGRTPPGMDLFVLTLPQYSRPPKAPRPRPLTYGDFQLLVSPDNIGLLEAADRDDVGVADIWLTQAFQGGRISETLKLRLGCVGLVGHRAAVSVARHQQGQRRRLRHALLPAGLRAAAATSGEDTRETSRALRRAARRPRRPRTSGTRSPMGSGDAAVSPGRAKPRPRC
ncbi:MAG TPA: hypothetical protein VMW56_11850 [Candidatus Margulisiibacteriota bacterium]|nr:hypothetical protein [Candidatus Margulisiibacteriota bacterium]